MRPAMSVRKQLTTLLAVFIGGLTIVAAVAVTAVFLIRGEIVRLSEETSPIQVSLAKLQRGFERISGNFSRISTVMTETELAEVEQDNARTIEEVDTIANDLAGRNLSIAQDALQLMKKTREELRLMAKERIESRRRVAVANQSVAREIESVVEVTRGLAKSMEALQKDSQELLLRSKKLSQEANSRIKRALVLREKTAEIRSLVQEVGQVEKKYRLSVLEDKTKSVVDAIAAQDVGDLALAAQVKTLADNFGASFQGAAGLLAARAAVLAAPDDANARQAFDERSKALMGSIDALSGRALETIDQMELSASKGNQAMNQAAQLISDIGGISTAALEADARARTIQALAWQLVAAGDIETVDRLQVAVTSVHEQAQQGLDEIRKGLAVLNRANEVQAVAAAIGGFGRAKELLVGGASVALAVRQGLETQAKAESLFTSAIQSIRRIAVAGSDRARDAEGAQALAVGRIGTLSGATLLTLGVVAFLVLGIGGMSGARIRGSVVAGDEQMREGAARTLRIVEEVKRNTAALRATSVQLGRTSGLVTDQVESMAASAGLLQTSMERIAENAARAAEVGSTASELVEEAGRTITRLSGASKQIGTVTEVIRNISMRTNLLALNAAVEAARAGAAGSGFGVVADEVKSLAAACAASTEDIQQRIRATQEEVRGAADGMNRIAGIIADVRQMQKTIAGAVDEQKTATLRIGENIQRTAAGCRGTESGGGVSAMASQLARMAEELEQLCETAS